MVETTVNRFNPETGKPNPVSLREYLLMDRHEVRAFGKGMSIKEQWNFLVAFSVGYDAMPKSEAHAIAKAHLAKLQARDNTKIGDKLELAWAKFALKDYEMWDAVGKKAKRLKEKMNQMPKWARRTKSPYLIAATKPL